MRARTRVTTASYSAQVYGRRIARSMRSLACCSGRWKAGARRSPDAARSISAGVQSIGSSDPRRKRSVRVPSMSAVQERIERGGRVQIASIRAQVHARQRHLVVARRLRRAAVPRRARATRRAALGAAGGRNHAVRARLLAAGLDAEGEGGAVDWRDGKMVPGSRGSGCRVGFLVPGAFRVPGSRFLTFLVPGFEHAEPALPRRRHPCARWGRRGRRRAARRRPRPRGWRSSR